MYAYVSRFYEHTITYLGKWFHDLNLARTVITGNHGFSQYHICCISFWLSCLHHYENDFVMMPSERSHPVGALFSRSETTLNAISLGDSGPKFLSDVSHHNEPGPFRDYIHNIVKEDTAAVCDHSTGKVEDQNRRRRQSD